MQNTNLDARELQHRLIAVTNDANLIRTYVDTDHQLLADAKLRGDTNAIAYHQHQLDRWKPRLGERLHEANLLVAQIKQAQHD